MFNINKITLLLILTFLLSAAHSQKKEIILADSLYADLQFNTAAESYEKAIRKYKEDSPEKQYAVYRLAECYWMMNEPDNALPYYKQLTETNFGETEPTLYLRYASILRSQGDVADAREFYLKYLDLNPGNKEAKTGLESCEWILVNSAKKAQVNVSPVDAINSTEDDFGPAFLSSNHDELIFTSNRFRDNVKSLDEWTGATFSDLYFSTLKKDEWDTPELVGLGTINSDIHEGTPTLSGDFKTMYFTRCGKTGLTRSYCQIWKTQRTQVGWSLPKPVITDSTANVGQPSLSKDELTLIFASDRQGSVGGKDLWVVHRNSKDEDFGDPVLLGPGINTPGDEVFPYLFNDTTLYFSSNGYKGYGEWDIFRTTKRNNGWSTPENLQEPYNSGYDDFGITIIKPGVDGYFTSNRPGGKGGDDIYHFTFKVLLFTVSGHVKDNMTLLSMNGAQVLLVRDRKDTLAEKTNRQGYYEFDNSQVPEDHDYELIFRKDNYFSKKATFSTKPNKDDYNFNVDMELEPIPEKPIVLPDILYALDKWDLAPQYQDSLMQLVRLLKDNENLVIELRSHTDSRGSNDYNDVLSQKRAQSVVDFLVSQGVDPGRLVAKGYGERIPRTLDKDYVRENYRFKAGTVLTDQYINSLPNQEVKEAAYQLNRRTEFAVLAKDYKPGSVTTAKLAAIQVVSDSTGNAIAFSRTADGKIQISCYINDFTVDGIIDPKAAGSAIDEAIVLDLLKKGGINRNDFQGNFEDIIQEDQIAENTVVILNKIRIGENVINGIEARIHKDLGGYFIIGKDIMDKLGPYLVDEDTKQIIFK